jgi:hypothetical protein
MAKPGPAPEVTTDDVLAVFDERDDPTEPLTAREVGEAAGCSRRTALKRLDDLADRDAIASKKVGGRARVWWVPADRPSPGELEDDPLLTAPAREGGPTDVSANVDKYAYADPSAD